MLYLLPTDYIIWSITLTTLAFIIKNLKQDTTKKFWQQLFSSSVAASAIITMVLFFVIALLDSVHIRTNNQNYTALDQVIQPIGQRDEVSYSAPLATKSFVNTTNIENNKVSITRQKLLHITGRNYDANTNAVINSTILSSLITICLLILFCIYQKSTKPIQQLIKPDKKNPGIAYRAILTTVFILTTLVLLIFNFSPHYYLLGTSKTGLEILYMGIKGIRTGLAIGLITTVFMLPFAIVFGISAGYFGGKIDSIIQYIYTTLSSIPGVLLIAAAILSLDIFMYKHSNWFIDHNIKADFRLLSLCFILGITGWTSLCRLLRGEVLKLRELDFVVHAKVVGMHPFKIMFKHILPNVLHIIIITVVLDFSGLILAEAVLSYIGVGVDPTMQSWGNMINAARLELSRDPAVWWPLLCAVGLMFIMVLSINLLADKIRSLNDPRAL